jgi:tetratricopeptide (TPR) repeat protein
MPVHTHIEEHEDGGRTVWLSEHDPMLRMKGMVGIHLSPGKAMIEARVRLYNRTPLPQTFLWWANVAARVNDQYQSFFPPDVTFVADHAKRAVSSFPVARNAYYGVDYRPGTDISWYKNIPVPTSYMVTKSRYDFFGGYDHGRKAGFVHTSNHHVAPGKKMWTWGNAEFGYAWDRHLTDEDGPYVELMAGAYTDNQPDFSWLQPYETKTFSQYWYPIQRIGPAKNANTDAALNLEVKEEKIHLGVCVTSARKIRIVLKSEGHVIGEWSEDAIPGKPFLAEVEKTDAELEGLELVVLDEARSVILSYRPEKLQDVALPDPATEPPPPEDIVSSEELYLTGLHLEQYRHATRAPELYWQEGLKRDPDDARINNAVGLLYLRKGEFDRAGESFERANRRLIFRNPNPYDGEPSYNLGLAHLFRGHLDEAYTAFHKAVWNYAWQSCGYYALATISATRGNYQAALEEVERSLQTNTANLKARALRASLLRLTDRVAEAEKLIEETLAIDPLDLGTRAQKYLLLRRDEDVDELATTLGNDVQSLLDVAYDLLWSGQRQDAFDLFSRCGTAMRADHPLYWYTLWWIADALGMNEQAQQYAEKAELASPRYCFPARLEEMMVLESAIRKNPARARAHYYLGNLYYDKRRYEYAIASWRRAAELDPEYPTVWRNLGIAEFNVLHHPEEASTMYQRAFAADSADARLLYEWDQLKKRAGLGTLENRLQFLCQHRSLVEERDDLMVEFITLLNQCGEQLAALEILATRCFSPWEGGEGMVSTQYVTSHRILGRECLRRGEGKAALDHFEAARIYPWNLGEGKHLLTLERDLDYLSALAMLSLGNVEAARRFLEAAAAALTGKGIHSYFQAMAMQELGRTEDARNLFKDLLQYADAQKDVEVKIDYFATSLPNLLLFDDDLNLRNRQEMQFLSALALHGLGSQEMAQQIMGDLLRQEPGHSLAREMYTALFCEPKPAEASEKALTEC